MRTLTSGLALALMGGLLISPLGAAESRRQDGVIAGSAAAEAKQPYSNYIIRGRDVTTNNIAQTTTLDANADFALNSMMAGTYMVELAGYYLLGAAAAAGVTAGLAGGNPDVSTVTVVTPGGLSVNPTGVSGAQ